jgi:ribonuclease HI
MEPLAAIEVLQYYATRGGEEKKLAAMTAKYLVSMECQGRGSEAVADNAVAEILGKARLFHDCGWRPSTEHPEPLTIYCDGSCIGNGWGGRAVAGFGVIVKRGTVTLHQKSERLDSAEYHTNQRAELRGLHYACTYLSECGMDLSGAVIYSDSKYAIDCLETWGPNWAAAGWVKYDRKPILHADVIVPLYGIWQELKHSGVLMKHVKAHTGADDAVSKGNAEADALARAATA